MTTSSPELTSQDQDRLSLFTELKEHVKSHGSNNGWAKFITIAERSNGDTQLLLSTIRSREAEIKAYLKHGKDSGVTSEESLIPPLPKSAQLPSTLSNGGCPWLDRYIAHSRIASPEGFDGYHEACGLATLSTVAARRVKIPFNTPDYTPLMIALVGDSTLFAKSTTAKVERKVLKAAGLHWLMGPNETTPERLIADLAGTIPRDFDSFSPELQAFIQRRLAMSGQRGWYYAEFKKLIRAMTHRNSSPMTALKELLTILDDCEDEYENATIGRGDDHIDKPYLSFMASMTVTCLKEAGKRGGDFWSDGFFARFAFICPPIDSNIDSPFDGIESDVPIDVWLPLKQWHERLGEPQISIEPIIGKDNKETGRYQIVPIVPLKEETAIFGDGVHDAWKRYRSALKKLIKELKADGNEDFSSSYGRLATKAMRIAALIASLENQGCVEMKHWALAQSITERWREYLHDMYLQVNKGIMSPEVEIERNILRTIIKIQEQEGNTLSGIGYDVQVTASTHQG